MTVNTQYGFGVGLLLAGMLLVSVSPLWALVTIVSANLTFIGVLTRIRRG